MPTENSNKTAEVTKRLERARELLDEALDLISETSKTSKPAAKAKITNSKLDFSMAVRAFVKRHAKGLSGPKKFTLLVAYLAKGDPAARVPMSDVESTWSKVTGILGAYNPVHASRARESDWVTTEKTGSYHLRPTWEEIFS